MSLRIAVVEDEARVAARLLRMLREILGDELELLRHERTLEAALALVEEMPLDALFLDLNLHGQDGFRLLDAAVAASFHTIVVSAHGERALEAFERGVLDFVPKPYSRERLEKAVERLRSSAKAAGSGAKVLAIRKLGRVDLIEVDRIVHLKGAGNYAEIVLDDGSTHLHDKTLDRLEQLLPERFLRVHRSVILDLHRIESLLTHPGGRYEAQLKDGSTVTVSRSRIGEVRRWLELG